MTDEEIVRALAAIDPVAENDYGDLWCFLCDGKLHGGVDLTRRDSGIDHEPTCEWVAAVERYGPPIERRVTSEPEQGQP